MTQTNTSLIARRHAAAAASGLQKAIWTYAAATLERPAADTLCQSQAGEELRSSPLFSSFDSPGGSASPAGVKARL